MSNTRCVIDASGFYVTFVLMANPIGPRGTWVPTDYPHKYQMGHGEALVNANPPGNSFVRPRWNGSTWVEAATDEEVAAWEAAKPVPEPAPPSPVELLAVEMTTAMAGMQLQHDMAIAELTVAIAAGTEVK